MLDNPLAEEQRYLAYGMVAEEIHACLRDGKQPDLHDLIRRYPDMETEIRQLAPAMAG